MLYNIILSGKSGCASCHHEGVCAKHAPLQIKSLETPLSLVIQRSKRWLSQRCHRDGNANWNLPPDIIYLILWITSSSACSGLYYNLPQIHVLLHSEQNQLNSLSPISPDPSILLSTLCHTPLPHTHTQTQESVSAMPPGCRHRHGKLLPPPSCSPHTALPLTWRLEITYGWIRAFTTLSRRWVKNGASD